MPASDVFLVRRPYSRGNTARMGYSINDATQFESPRS